MVRKNKIGAARGKGRAGMETLGLARQECEGQKENLLQDQIQGFITGKRHVSAPPPPLSQCSGPLKGVYFCAHNNIQVKMFVCMCVVESGLLFSPCDRRLLSIKL